MGALTRAAIVTRGVTLSGCNPNFTLELNFALNAWLREMASSYPWPILRRTFPTAPGGGIPLAQGAASVLIGAGSGGITDAIAFVYDPIFLYTSDFSVRGEMRIRKLVGGSPNDNEMLTNPVTNQGLPQICKLKKMGAPLGQWQLWPMPVPDRSYLGVLDYGNLPADLDTAVGGVDDTTIPWYENDRTMIALVEAEGHRLSQRQAAFDSRMRMVASLTTEDRSRYGTAPGTNDDVGLDEGVFRSGRPSNHQNWGSF